VTASTAGNGKIKRYEIECFCREKGIQKKQLATMMGLHKQRIYNIENSPNEHVIDFNVETRQVYIVRKETIIHECEFDRGET
jgi:DNA-binding XRE family transcriptional regulator